MNNLQDQARAHYKRGDYKTAISLFDRAIGRSPSVQLLDNRAACHEKLKDYTTALKDAKQAIQLHREDAVGYLRAGRVLVKMEKASVALEIYTHGLRSVRHVGMGYEQLRKVHKELMDELCPPKSVDPLTVLPRELAETVLEYLSFRQRMNACLVSKPWAHFIRTTPSLWRHLDLSAAKRKVKGAFVSRAINIGRAKLKIASLSNLYDFDKALRALVKHCPLEELTLLECGLLGRNLVPNLEAATCLRSLKITEASPLSTHELYPLLSALANRVEVLECFTVAKQEPRRYFARCPKLQSLLLNFGDNCDHNSCLKEFADNFPLLQKLTLVQDRHGPIGSLHGGHLHLRNCTRLRTVELHMHCHGPYALQLPSELTTFAASSIMLLNPAEGLRSLDRLSVRGYNASRKIMELLHTASIETDGVFQETGESAQPSQLRKLAMMQAALDEDQVSLNWVLSNPRLRALESLSVAQCAGFNDDCAASLVKAKLINLNVIDLTATDVTGVGVKALVSSFNLEKLVLDDCRLVSSDAVDWARAKGVTVKYRMNTPESSSGRKVRY